jgi:hypothetical protein
MLPIVKLVESTDSMPQLVNVLLVTMNQVHVKNVYNVITDVLLVIFMNVSNVTIQPTDIFQIVTVNMELGIMVLLIVNHVIPNVLIVKMVLVNVALVPLTELKELKTTNHLVHVHQVKLKLMDIVIHVTTIVKIVLKTTSPNVHHVPILESVITVFVQKNGTIMVMILNVNHVKSFVNNVSTPTLVPNVKNTEIITISHIVHVHITKWIMVLKDSVMNVTTDVKNVLMFKIGLMEDTVLLVLITETPCHQLVVVHTELLKSVNYVFHVTNKDVKPVVKTKPVLTMLITVVLVKLTESKIHLLAHVTLDIMKNL